MPDNQITWKDIERAAMHDTTLQALVAVVRGGADRRLIAAVLELSKLEHERDGAQPASGSEERLVLALCRILIDRVAESDARWWQFWRPPSAQEPLRHEARLLLPKINAILSGRVEETVDAASWNAMTVETLGTSRHLGESHREK